MSTAIIIQARMGSTRLPGKVLMQAAGKSLLWHLLTRLQSRRVGEIIVATSVDPADEAIALECQGMGVKTVRGSEKDVLSRFLLAAAETTATTLLRITADCPLLDPALVWAMVEEFHARDVDYLSNSDGVGLPVGQDVEVMTRDALERAAKLGREPHHREHVTPYLYEEQGRFVTANVVWPKSLRRTWPADLSHHRWTVDAAEDFDLVRRIIESLYRPGQYFGIQAIVSLLQANPEWVELNQAVVQRSYLEVAS